MSAASLQILESYFEALRNHDWERLTRCLAGDVNRTGPYCDVVRGRDAYVRFLAERLPTLENYRLEVARIHELDDGGALALLSETLDVNGVATEYPEALLFAFDDTGRILRVDIFIQRPPSAARG